MIGRAGLMAVVVALGVAGGVLLGGCGGGTKTVTVSGALAPTSTIAGAAASRTSSTATPTTSPSAAGTGGSTPSSAGGQSPSATRTAPAPAFTRTTAQPGEAASSTAAAAAAVVRAQGYIPDNTSDYHPAQTLRVLLGTRTGSADGYDQRAFFFLGGRYLGTDSSQPSASVRVVSQSDTEVTLAYALYRSHDALCCPSGGQATVHFQLNDGKLVPLQPIPPFSSTTGLARQ